MTDISDDAVRAFMAAAEAPGVLDEYLDVAVRSVDGDRVRAGLEAALPHLGKDREWRIQWFSSNDGVTWRAEGWQNCPDSRSAHAWFSHLVVSEVWRVELQCRRSASEWTAVRRMVPGICARIAERYAKGVSDGS